jgi:Ca2+-transporting ATPase
VKVRIVRNGETHTMSIFDIVVGDIVLIFRGEKIPADGLFVPGLEGTCYRMVLSLICRFACG